MALVDAEVDSAVFEIVPFAVETRVGERRTPAGLENRITCQVLDQVGEPIVDLQSEAEINPDTGFERFERIEPVFGSVESQRQVVLIWSQSVVSQSVER